MLGDEWHHIDYLASLERQEALHVRIERELRAGRVRDRIKWTLLWAATVVFIAALGWVLSGQHANAADEPTHTTDELPACRSAWIGPIPNINAVDGMLVISYDVFPDGGDVEVVDVRGAIVGTVHPGEHMEFGCLNPPIDPRDAI